MTRQTRTSSLARRLLRTPAWVAAAAAAFLLGGIAGPIAVSAGPVSHSHGGVAAGGRSAGHSGHVFVIMMENTGYNALLSPANPNTKFIQHLAAAYGLATRYFGVTHPSLPNYLAATSGSTWGSNSDDTAQVPFFNHQNLVDQFAAAHVTWKGYMQSLPHPGDLVDTTPNGLYVRKHDPFLLYPDVISNPARRNLVVPLSQLATDLASGHVPQFAWISPNLCDDMHGMSGPPCPFPPSPHSPQQATLYKDGNAFLHKWVGLITHSKAWNGRSVIFITWDEGGYADTAPFGPLDNRGGPDSPVLPATPPDPATAGGGDLVGGTVYGGGHVPMIVIAKGVGHQVDNVRADHYSLLQTIEQIFRLPLLGNASDTVQVHSLAPLLH